MPGNNEKTVLYKQVVKDLEKRIIAGIYQKGDLLPSEKEMIESFGVSRITIRKALSILSDMGFIRTVQGKGSEVLFSMDGKENEDEFTDAIAEYRESFMSSTQIRLMLEPQIAREVALTATTEQIRQLVEMMSDDEKLEDSYEFHMTLAFMLGNEPLIEIMNKLFMLEGEKATLNIIQPEKYVKVGKILKQHHRKILQAIEQRDGEFAYFYMKEHTQYVARIYEEYFELLSK